MNNNSGNVNSDNKENLGKIIAASAGIILAAAGVAAAKKLAQWIEYKKEAADYDESDKPSFNHGFKRPLKRGIFEVDADGDGKIDAVLVDSDGDGKVDVVITEEDGGQLDISEDEIEKELEREIGTLDQAEEKTDRKAEKPEIAEDPEEEASKTEEVEKSDEAEEAEKAEEIEDAGKEDSKRKKGLRIFHIRRSK